MVTYWECYECRRVFQVISSFNSKKRPICFCGCKLTVKRTKFHYDNYCKKQNKEIYKRNYLQSHLNNFSGGNYSALGRNPRYKFLKEGNGLWKGE